MQMLPIPVRVRKAIHKTNHQNLKFMINKPVRYNKILVLSH